MIPPSRCTGLRSILTTLDHSKLYARGVRFEVTPANTYSDNTSLYGDPSRHQTPDMPEDYETMDAPGPLAISAVAIFGNESYVAATQRAARTNTSAAAAELCRSQRMPFLLSGGLGFGDGGSLCTTILARARGGDAGVEFDYSNEVLSRLLFLYRAFNRTDAATDAFAIAGFYASEALLTQSTRYATERHLSRTLFTSPGRSTTKPSVSLAAMIIMSVLLAVEVLSLVLLAVYIHRTPSWTRTLKSTDIAQLAHAMDRGTLPPAGSPKQNVYEALQAVDGRVGVETTADGATHIVHGGSGTLCVTTGQMRERVEAWREVEQPRSRRPPLPPAQYLYRRP